MGKAGFILHGARGKIGNLVARKSEVGTILAEHVVPSNPRTAGQMRTRVAFGTVAKAGAALAALVGISFQGESSIKGARRRFNSVNMAKFCKLLKNDIGGMTVAPKGMSVLIPNTYIVSDGTIRNATLGNVQLNAQGDGFSQTTHETTFKFGETYTAAEIIQCLFGVLPGDQITLVGIRSGVPVEYFESQKEILRDGQMVSARVFFKDAEELSSIEPYTMPTPGDEGWKTAITYHLADIVRNSIKEGYETFVSALSRTNLYLADAGEAGAYISLDFEAALGYDGNSMVPILGDPDSIMAFGYFRSHLNEAGTQWLFSRCYLVRISPEYTDETYRGELPINYGLDYNLALDSYLSTNAISSTRYTETGGSENTLGF